MPSGAPQSETTVAVILGAGNWPQYPSLEGGAHFANSRGKFAEYLRHPRGLALAEENICDRFDDDRSPPDIVNTIDEFLQRRNQALAAQSRQIRDFLFYFVGHAECHESTEQYHLILRYTREKLWYASSLEIFKLFDMFATNTPGARRYLILDACYAGIANNFIYQSSSPGAAIGRKELDVFSDKGTALLSSSGPKSRSKAPLGEECTMFTGALMEVLAPSGRRKSKRLSLRELRERTAEVIQNKYYSKAVWPEVYSGSPGYRGVADSPILPIMTPAPDASKTSRLKSKPPVVDVVAPTAEPSGTQLAPPVQPVPLVPPVLAEVLPPPVTSQPALVPAQLTTQEPKQTLPPAATNSGIQSIPITSTVVSGASPAIARPQTQPTPSAQLPSAATPAKPAIPAVITPPRPSFTPAKQGAAGSSVIFFLIWLAMRNYGTIDTYLRDHGWLEKKPDVPKIDGLGISGLNDPITEINKRYSALSKDDGSKSWNSFGLNNRPASSAEIIKSLSPTLPERKAAPPLGDKPSATTAPSGTVGFDPRWSFLRKSLPSSDLNTPSTTSSRLRNQLGITDQPGGVGLYAPRLRSNSGLIPVPVTSNPVPLIGTNPGQIRDDNSLKMKMAWIPPGTFQMGSPTFETGRQIDEGPVNVTLTKGLWIGQFEVTQSEWRQVMQTTPWSGKEFVMNGDDYPATCISWQDATAFCKKLTDDEHLAKRLPPDWAYTLPSEAEWEYACRAGTSTRFSFGTDEAALPLYAWFGQNCWDRDEKYAHRVGQKKPNAWGLYDMHGNALEWCRDRYRVQLLGGTDPEVTLVFLGVEHVCRGGNWVVHAPDQCRSAARTKGEPDTAAHNGLGFRISCEPSGR